jgi:phosphate uptake regulator
MEFVGVDELQSNLLVEFVDYATDEGGGFAGFRETATKRNSLVDRLSEITLPSLQDIESDLERYLDQKHSVKELDDQHDRLFNLLNRIVYELYELEEEKVEMVESTR